MESSSRQEADTSIRQVWPAFLVEGIVLFLLGAAAIIIAQLGPLLAAFMLAWLFLIGGFAGLVATLVGHRAPGFVWGLTSSIVTILAGGFLLIWPSLGVMSSLALVLAAYLAVDGVVSVLIAIAHQRRRTRHWFWLLLTGLVDIGLAAAIVALLGNTAYFVLTVMFGVDFLFGGAALITIALAARHPLPERD